MIGDAGPEQSKLPQIIQLINCEYWRTIEMWNNIIYVNRISWLMQLINCSLL